MQNIQRKGPLLRRLSDAQSLATPAACHHNAPRQQFARRHWVTDIVNRSGRPARGIEITIEGLCGNDAFRAFYLSRAGTPRVLHGPQNSIAIRYESEWNDSLREVNQLCREQPDAASGSTRYQWDICLYGANGPERCGLELSTINVVASYRWLTPGENTAVYREPDLIWVPAH